MYGSLRLLMVPLAAAGLLALAGSALASSAQASRAADPGKHGVIDNAKLFSAEAVTKAEDRIKALARTSGRGLLIETMEKKDVPESYRDRLADKKTRDRAYTQLAEDRYESKGVHGLYVLIVKQDRVQVMAGKRTVAAGYNDNRRVALRDSVLAPFSKDKHDEALLAAVTTAEEQLPSLRDLGTTRAPVNSANRGAAADSEPIGIVGWVIIGLVALVVIWLVVGLLRAFSGGGGGGGGGGGFFSSLMGGLFGAAIGMYMYHSMFGGHAYGSSGYDGGTGPSDGDAGAGAGGDYGGGGDAGGGAGGGDWGGGGDAGGGDWGGGGGGGDWGGGGGGGDW